MQIHEADEFAAKRALCEVLRVVNPSDFEAKRKVAGDLLLKNFLAIGPRTLAGLYRVNGDKLHIGKSITITFSNGAEGIFAQLTDKPKIAAPLEYDYLEDTFYGEVDPDVVPTPGRFYPRKSGQRVLAELTLKLVKEAGQP